MKTATAIKVLKSALNGGTVRFTGHAMDQIEVAGLTFEAAEHDLDLAADRGTVAPNKAHAGRFVAIGDITISSFEVIEPNIVVVTVMVRE